MEQIYVTGHRNPDTDSVVSAMAYAALRNALGERQYVAARLGHISDETRLILDKFGFEPPQLIKNMRTQVQDLDYDVPPILHEAVTVGRAWTAMEEDHHITAIPITDDEGHLRGMMTSGDIASYDMRSAGDPALVDVPLFNILSVLEGQLLGETEEVVNAITGEVILALPQSGELPPFRQRETVLICGNQPDMLRAAVEFGVKPFFMGKGTNLLVSDGGADLLVVKAFDGLSRLELLPEGEWPGHRTIQAGSGVSLARLSNFALEHGLTGLEFAHGIPGSVGGGVYMNAGAYGGELGQVVSAETAPAEMTSLDHKNRIYRQAIVEGYEDILVTVQAPCAIVNGSIQVGGGFDLRVGTTVYIKGPGYMGSGPVVSIQREVAK